MSKHIDLGLIEKLAAIHCTNTEIASTVGCDSSLLSKPKYSEIITKGKERGKMSLRRKMWDTAMNGNVTMQIFLSKQMLGYADKQVEANPVADMTLEQKRDYFKQALNILEMQIKNGSTTS